MFLFPHHRTETKPNQQAILMWWGNGFHRLIRFNPTFWIGKSANQIKSLTNIIIKHQYNINIILVSIINYPISADIPVIKETEINGEGTQKCTSQSIGYKSGLISINIIMYYIIIIWFRIICCSILWIFTFLPTFLCLLSLEFSRPSASVMILQRRIMTRRQKPTPPSGQDWPKRYWQLYGKSGG